jgi:hypothetical protein
MLHLCPTIWSWVGLGRKTTRQRPARRALPLFDEHVRRLSVQQRRTMTWKTQKRRKGTNYLHSIPPPTAVPMSRTGVGAAVGHLRTDAKAERGARALARPRGDHTVVVDHDLVQYLAAGLVDGTMTIFGAQEVAVSVPAAHIGQEVGASAAPLHPVLGRTASVEQVDTVRAQVAFRPAAGSGRTAMGGGAASRPKSWSKRFQRTTRLTPEKTWSGLCRRTKLRWPRQRKQTVHPVLSPTVQEVAIRLEAMVAAGERASAARPEASQDGTSKERIAIAVKTKQDLVIALTLSPKRRSSTLSRTINC